MEYCSPALPYQDHLYHTQIPGDHHTLTVAEASNPFLHSPVTYIKTGANTAWYTTMITFILTPLTGHIFIFQYQTGGETWSGKGTTDCSDCLVWGVGKSSKLPHKWYNKIRICIFTPLTSHSRH